MSDVVRYEVRDGVAWLTLAGHVAADLAKETTALAGQDILDALGAHREPTMRLRHIADLGGDRS